MTKAPAGSDVEVRRYVAETADRLHDRLAEVSSTVLRTLEDQIPDLRGDAGLMELLGASVDGNVDTVLHALRYDIAVERVEAPTAALEYDSGAVRSGASRCRRGRYPRVGRRRAWRPCHR